MAPKLPPRSTNTTASPVGIDTKQSTAAATFGVPTDFPNVSALDESAILDNPHQARKHFDHDAIAQLAESIERRGLLSPILVRPHGQEKGKYVLIAGERRLRAIRLLKQKTIFAIVTFRDDPESLSLIENLARSNLTMMETADGLKNLMDNRKLQQDEAAAILGISVSDIREYAAILRLPSRILDVVRSSSPDAFSRSALVELSRIDDDVAMSEMWSRMTDVGATVSELRSVRKASNKTPVQRSPNGAALAALGRTLNAFTSGVKSLKTHREHMEQAHRERLLEIRAEIDELLGQPILDVRLDPELQKTKSAIGNEE